MAESKEYMTLPEENGSINISEEVIAGHRRGRRPGSRGRVRDDDRHGRQCDGPAEQQEKCPEGCPGREDRHDRRGSGAGSLFDRGIRSPHPEVAENAQKAVASAVEAMTGCQVGAVNIHVGASPCGDAQGLSGISTREERRGRNCIMVRNTAREIAIHLSYELSFTDLPSGSAAGQPADGGGFCRTGGRGRHLR